MRVVTTVISRLGDRLNPILVKETRQALKSRQFLVSFALVLCACWLWSVVAATMIGPAIHYRASGVELFYGYYLILGFPLAVVVPFFSYRSLSAETEENTYELLLITTLAPRQIVAGKLGSAVVQMVVYLSAVAPCLAFTYLLRGIDLLSIGVMLLFLVFTSLGLSMVGLLLATVTQERFAQVVLTVGMVIGLFWTFLGGAVVSREFLSSGAARFLREQDFWIATAALATAYASYFALGFVAATARLTFVAENRSTALRITMLVQYACFAGWMAWPWLEGRGRQGVVEVFLIVIAAHWYVMGLLMTAESPGLSARVQRRLPRSLLGRVLTTWFQPGPATGLMFATASLLGGILFAGLVTGLAAATGWFPASFGPRPTPAHSTVVLAVLLWSYVTALLGAGKLIIAVLRRLSPIDLLRGTAIHLVLLGLCTAVPLFIQFSSTRWRTMGYTALQASNPFWTVFELIDRRALHPDTAVLLAIIPSCALLMWLLNLPSACAAAQQEPGATPERILADDADRAPQGAPKRTSPWD